MLPAFLFYILGLKRSVIALRFRLSNKMKSLIAPTLVIVVLLTYRSQRFVSKTIVLLTKAIIVEAQQYLCSIAACRPDDKTITSIS